MIPVNKKVAGGLSVGAGLILAAFLTTWEGFAPVAVHERVDPPHVITWCFGRTNYDDPTVKAGTHFTKEECEKTLVADFPKYAEPVAACIPQFHDLPDPLQASLVSFAYNLGPRTLCRSSVAHHINNGNIEAGCDAMMAFVRANGVVLQGLKNRRRAERELCMKGIK